MGLDDVMKLVS